MKQPYFSIVIPTYNRADLVSKTINSLLVQTYQDFEIIVVDNKSTDNTLEVLEQYKHLPNFRVFAQPQNFERARSRNKGIEEATGRFVSLLDSDDLFYPTCLADAYEYSKAHPEARFFHCAFEIIDDNGKVVTKANLHEPQDPFKALATGNYISNIGLFIEASVVKRVKLDETPVLIGMEDYDFLLRILDETGHVGFISKVNCGVLQHPGRTLLTQEYPAMEARVRYFVQKSLQGGLFHHRYAAYRKDFISGNELYLSGAAAVRGLSKPAFRHLLKALGAKKSNLLSITFWKHFIVIFKYMFK